MAGPTRSKSGTPVNFGWTRLTLAGNPTERDPNSVGSIAESNGLFTATINDVVGRTEVSQGLWREFPIENLLNAQLVQAGAAYKDLPHCLELCLQVTGTLPSEPITVFLGVVNGNGDLADSLMDVRWGVLVDFQGVNPRGGLFVDSAEVYGSTNANVRTTLALIDITHSGDSISQMNARSSQYVRRVTLKSDGAIQDSATENMGAASWSVDTWSAPKLVVGVVALAPMGGEDTVDFYAGYRWAPPPLNGIAMALPGD